MNVTPGAFLEVVLSEINWTGKEKKKAQTIDFPKFVGNWGEVCQVVGELFGKKIQKVILK